jgi:hypothetical protein
MIAMFRREKIRGLSHRSIVCTNEIPKESRDYIVGKYAIGRIRQKFEA